LASLAKEREFHAYDIKAYLKNKTFHRIIIGVITLLIAFTLIVDGAAPKKYKLSLGEESKYDIEAPWDIENTVKTEQNREKAKKAVQPVMVKDSNVSNEILSNWVDFVLAIDESRKKVLKNIGSEKLDRENQEDSARIKEFEQQESNSLDVVLRKININLSNDQLLYLISEDKCKDISLENFKAVIKGMIDNIVQDDITSERLSDKIAAIEKGIKATEMSQDLKIIGSELIRGVIRPNWVIDKAATDQKRDIAYYDDKNKEMIKKGTRILSKNEKVTEDKLKILEDLNLLETKSRFDYSFVASTFVLVILLAFFLILYMRHFGRKFLYSRRDVSIIVLLSFDYSGS
jgi:membrane-associated HD superfamily phosphohydrolase